MRISQICVWSTLLTVLLALGNFDRILACQRGCTCITVPAKEEESDEDAGNGRDMDEDIGMPMPRGRKVNCSNNPYRFSAKADLVEELKAIPLDTIDMDLSKNELAVIKKGSLNGLSDLQRLDLSHNKISRIEPGAFEGLHNLKKLDLSNNNLGSINSSLFAGLPKLTKLNLSFNQLNTIPDGTFNDLPALRKIEFQSEFLRCDCHLQWIVKWSRDKKVRIKSTTSCAIPRELKGTALKKLKKKDLHCDRPLELPLFEIIPGMSQIVFEGDKLPFQCRASVVDPDTKMYWLRYGQVVETNRSTGIFVLSSHVADDTVMMHSLVLEDLKSTQKGVWECMVSTPQGNVTKSVNIVVINSNAAQCDKNITKTDKGLYVWKAAVAGVTKELPCKIGEGKVTHECDKAGRWTNLNVSACAYTSEVLRGVQEVVNVDPNSSKILKEAENLERLVSAPFLNKEDPLSTINPEFVNLASMAIYKLSQHTTVGNKIVKSILSSASKIMNISSDILTEAQRQRKSCTRIVKAIESIPGQLKEKQQSQSSDLIVMELKHYPKKDFKGVQCSRLDLTLDQNINRMVQRGNSPLFVCGEPVNETSAYAYLQLAHLTSVRIPPSIFKSVSGLHLENITTTTASPGDIISVQFIWYQNPSLFPLATGRHDDPALRGRTWHVVTGVISISLSERVSNLTEPIELVFEVPETSKRLVPAFWDFSANGGYGDWRTDGCSVFEKGKTFIKVHCDHLTAFAVLEDQSVLPISMFQMMEIVVYIGSCICLLCLMAVIITYVSCFKFLNVPRKMKHSVINICVSMLLLIITFTMGVKRTDHVKACQVVGIMLHYLSLVTLFWITVTASNMLKKFYKAEKPPPPPIDLPMPLPPKPIIRFYLLAWGVPSIICGITAAVSFEFYDEPNYCFLEWEPGLGAFVGPVAFLLILNLFFYLRISCVIRSSTGPLLNLEETQELHVTDIEMTSNHDRIETHSMCSDMTSKSAISSVMDFERRPITQLRALIAVCVLFVLTWGFGAITVAQPLTFIPYQELIFSYLYGVICAIFGLFMLIYYCLTRNDSRTSWKRFFLCEQQTVYEPNHMSHQSVPHANGHVTTGSGTDISNCNKISAKVVTNHENHVKKLEEEEEEESTLNLVPSKPPSVNDGSLTNSLNEPDPASFYNPRQNGVAKKFWEKKNKHNSKLLSKEMTKSLNINGSESESNFSIPERQRGTSQGYSSDGNGGNHHLNLDLQSKASALEMEKSGIHLSLEPTAPPSYNTVMSNSAPAYHLERNISSPMQQTLMGSPNCSVVSYQSSQLVPNHTRSPSSSSLGNRNHSSAFAVVSPRNNTLPRQGKNTSMSMPSSPEREIPDQNMVSGPSSVARMGDFDGSSQVSSSYSQCERQRSPRPNEYVSGYSSPPDGFSSNPGSTYKQYGMIDSHPQVGPISPIASCRHRKNSGGYSSDNSSRARRKLENNFVQQVEQRIPQAVNVNNVNSNHVNSYKSNNSNITNHVTSKPPLSPMSDSDCNSSRMFPDSDSQIHYKKYRHNDSDHNSEPMSKNQHHNKHGKTRDGNKKHSRHRGIMKQRSLDWDEQFKDKSPSSSVPYAYVNHNYTERVLQKLKNMAVTEHIDPNSKAFWVPRSSSSYNEIIQQENAHLCEDSSTTSSDDDDDSLDNIWVLQKEKRHKKNKKETSV